MASKRDVLKDIVVIQKAEIEYWIAKNAERGRAMGKILQAYMASRRLLDDAVSAARKGDRAAAEEVDVEYKRMCALTEWNNSFEDWMGKPASPLDVADAVQKVRGEANGG